MINITDWVAVIPPEEKTIAYVGEHFTQRRHFFLSDLQYADYAFYLDVAFDPSTVTSTTTPKHIESTQQTTKEVVDADGISVTATDSINKESYTQTSTVVDCDALTDIVSLWKLVSQDGIELVWTVLAQHTQLPGRLRAVLRAVGPKNEVKKSAIMNFTVASSIEALPAAPIPLSEHEQMEKAMVQALEQAAEDTYAAFDEKFEEAIGSLEEVKGLINERTLPATEYTYGTVKVASGISASTCGVGLTKDGVLRIEAATQDDIDDRWLNTVAITPRNLEYAVKSIGWLHYATIEEEERRSEAMTAYIDSKTEQAQNNAKTYTDEKTALATLDTLGTVRVFNEEDRARIGSGVVMKDGGALEIVCANEAAIDGRGNPYAPIVPANLEYAVKSVGDGYYITKADIPKIILSKNASEADIQEANGITLITPNNIEYAVKYIGDGYYATEEQVGDIEAALDSILAIQESLIGGDSV